MARKNAIQFTHKGNFTKTESFLKSVVGFKPVIRKILRKYGELGVESLREATPKDTGKTADSWTYEIEEDKDGSLKIVWRNTNVANGWVPVAILLQYGHATGNGGYVQGQDYINPAIDRIFQGLANDAWKEVNHERNR